MKAAWIIALCLAVPMLNSCGTSAEERHKIEQALLAKQARQDSVRTLLAQMDTALYETQGAIAMSKAELEAARVTLDRVKQWQFGRSRWQREQQIVNASLNVQQLEVFIVQLEEQEKAILSDKALTAKKAEYVEEWTRIYEENQ